MPPPGAPGRKGSETEASGGATRHQSRERALALLYEADMKAVSPGEVLASLRVTPDAFAVSLVQAVEDRRNDADRLLEAASVGWPLARMAVIDRLVLRVAVVELMDPHGPPVAVIIDEAVELAKTYSTDDSGGFVNGILSTIAAEVRA